MTREKALEVFEQNSFVIEIYDGYKNNKTLPIFGTGKQIRIRQVLFITLALDMIIKDLINALSSLRNKQSNPLEKIEMDTRPSVKFLHDEYLKVVQYTEELMARIATID